MTALSADFWQESGPLTQADWLTPMLPAMQTEQTSVDWQKTHSATAVEVKGPGGSGDEPESIWEMPKKAVEPLKTDLYKTELCRNWEESGECRYGLRCHFAHGHTELRNLLRHPKYKTSPCKTYMKLGSCPYGQRCCFSHINETMRPKVDCEMASLWPPTLPAPTTSLSLSWLSDLSLFKNQGASLLHKPKSPEERLWHQEFSDFNCLFNNHHGWLDDISPLRLN